MKPINQKIRQSILTLIWIVALIHFLKDITQDILQIPTIFDVLGNIQEDVSLLPSWAQWIIYGGGVGSFLAEIFLLISIPMIRQRKEISLLEKWVIGIVIFMLIYFPIVILLDPRFKIIF